MTFKARFLLAVLLCSYAAFKKQLCSFGALHHTHFLLLFFFTVVCKEAYSLRLMNGSGMPLTAGPAPRAKVGIEKQFVFLLFINEENTLLLAAPSPEAGSQKAAPPLLLLFFWCVCGSQVLAVERFVLEV